MNCRVCHDTRRVGWHPNGVPIRCGWCDGDEAPLIKPRDIRAERVARLKREAIVSVSQQPTWEKVCDPDRGDYLERLKVPGGWLYRTVMFSENESVGTAMCFVPDTPTEYRSL